MFAFTPLPWTVTDSWVRFSIRFDILDRTHGAFCAIVFIWSDDFSAFLTHKLVYEFFCFSRYLLGRNKRQ